jgi:integrating conjugative element protein (TIGR03749 family)
MKSFARSVVLVALGWGLIPVSQAVEILRWERLPLAVPLVVGQERVIFLDRNMRVGTPASLRGRLRVQTAGGALYLRASAPIEPTRVQLQDINTGESILLDLAAQPARADQTPLEPLRIVEEASAAGEENAELPSADAASQAAASPIAVVLTRFAAQSLYAPLRTVEPAAGIARANLRPDLRLDTLLPGLPIHAQPLAAWRLQDQWVTAVRLTNTAARDLDLDPRALQGDFVAATFQHPTLGPAGTPSDTTVLYLVTRGHGLAESLLPAISPIDASLNLPAATTGEEPDDEK